ncbi:hypothetical protein PR202_ga12443 [Eleusine coracana subsp. coracana]|uniref:Uncharacterized protein n=1 Tax=Eleusine coracana subsp. coracana TaxID=191504 RepID=A0AAV5CBM3_ELECO|nr:hypothetical protein PR202_ga12443 [Eleusine coracana subsp. coracana]
MLDNARGRDLRSPALGLLLLELRQLAYKAEDVLDELEYFHIQDEVDGTYETTDDHGLVLNARHTARTVAGKLKLPSCSCVTVFPHHRIPKLKFDRVEISNRMAVIVEQLKPVCAKVSAILDIELLGLIASNGTTRQQGTPPNEARNTTAQSIEPTLYGRDKLKDDVINDIIHGENECHSGIYKVGKLKAIQVLKRFEVLNLWHSDFFWLTGDESNAQFFFSVDNLTIHQCNVTGKELAHLISCFPNLSKLELWYCKKHERGAKKLETTTGLLPLPLQIKELTIISSPDVRLCSSSLQSQTSLRSLTISNCPKLLSSSSWSPSDCPFPTSLQYLDLVNVKDDIFTLTPLSNLTKLELTDCKNIISEDIWHLLTKGHLKRLVTRRSFNFFDCSEASGIMQALQTDGESRNPMVPIHGHFSSSLTELSFAFPTLEHFTKEQSDALQMLTSLQKLVIEFCPRLQSLTTGLSGLPNLRNLLIQRCDSICSLPKGGLPSSLSELMICPAIRSLHKGSLPSSLETLDIRESNKKLKRQCQKLKGIIPRVIT